MAKSAQQDTDYELLCEAVLVAFKAEGFVPCAKVENHFRHEGGGTTWNLDVALENADRSILVIAECKRWATPIVPATAASFAWVIRGIREQRRVLDTPEAVRAFLLVKNGASSGAHLVAGAGGIDIVECPDVQHAGALVASFVTSSGGKRFRSHEVATTNTVETADAVEVDLSS